MSSSLMCSIILCTGSAQNEDFNFKRPDSDIAITENKKMFGSEQSSSTSQPSMYMHYIAVQQ